MSEQSTSETHLAECPECDWSETADAALGAYFAARNHYMDTGHEADTHPIETDTEQ